jgi:hypothetical protein
MNIILSLISAVSAVVLVVILTVVAASAFKPAAEEPAAQISRAASFVSASNADSDRASAYSNWLREAHSTAARQGEESPLIDTF